jgi:hypothetical protein
MMMAKKFVPLLLGFLLCANSAYGMEPMTMAGVTAAIGAGLELLGQGVAQINSSANWATSKNFTPQQVQQVQAAIDYMKEKGFSQEANQAQTLLDNAKGNSWGSSTFVYREGKGKDMALTSGGPLNAMFNNGHITLYRNFFDVNKHDGIAIDTPGKRSRDQAQTLIHELEHLNTQANTTHIYIYSPFWDWEKGPIQKQVESLGGLGYTPEEIQTIRDTWAKGPYKGYVDLIDKALANLPKPAAPPPNTDASGPSEPAHEPNNATSGSGRPAPTTPSETPAAGNFPQPRATADQVSRAGSLGDQVQGGVPGANQQEGGRSGAPQGGYQGQSGRGSTGPQQPEQGPLLFPPPDPRSGRVRPTPPGVQLPPGGSATAGRRTPPGSPGGASCGPTTSCRCASGATGHIPCDRSMGRCHCGGGN